MKKMMKTLALVLTLAAAAAVTSACGGDDTTAPTATTATGPAIALFEGQLTIGGSAFYSFTTAADGLAEL